MGTWKYQATPQERAKGDQLLAELRATVTQLLDLTERCGRFMDEVEAQLPRDVDDALPDNDPSMEVSYGYLALAEIVGRISGYTEPTAACEPQWQRLGIDVKVQR